MCTYFRTSLPSIIFTQDKATNFRKSRFKIKPAFSPHTFWTEPKHDPIKPYRPKLSRKSFSTLHCPTFSPHSQKPQQSHRSSTNRARLTLSLDGELVILMMVDDRRLVLGAAALAPAPVLVSSTFAQHKQCQQHQEVATGVHGAGTGETLTWRKLLTSSRPTTNWLSLPWFWNTHRLVYLD